MVTWQGRKPVLGSMSEKRSDLQTNSEADHLFPEPNPEDGSDGEETAYKRVGLKRICTASNTE